MKKSNDANKGGQKQTGGSTEIGSRFAFGAIAEQREEQRASGSDSEENEEQFFS